jgi:hypothetical protein
VDPAVHRDGQGFAGVLVDDVEQLQDPTVGGLVELVVQRPQWSGCSAASRAAGAVQTPEPLALAAQVGTPAALPSASGCCASFPAPGTGLPTRLRQTDDRARWVAVLAQRHDHRTVTRSRAGRLRPADAAALSASVAVRRWYPSGSCRKAGSPVCAPNPTHPMTSWTQQSGVAT